MSESNWRKFLQNSGLIEADRTFRPYAPPSASGWWELPAFGILFAGSYYSGWYGAPGGLGFLIVWGGALSGMTLAREFPAFRKTAPPHFESLKLPGAAGENDALRPVAPPPAETVQKSLFEFLSYPGFYTRLAGTGFMATVATGIAALVAGVIHEDPIGNRYFFALMVHALSIPAFLAVSFALSVRRWLLKRRAATEQ